MEGNSLKSITVLRNVLLWVSPVSDQGPISLTVSRMKLEECTQSEDTG